MLGTSERIICLEVALPLRNSLTFLKIAEAQ
jgi:hypothetical protein